MADTVMVITDNSSEGQFLTEILTSRGYAVRVLPQEQINPATLAALTPALAIVDLACAAAYTHLWSNETWPVPVIFSGTLDSMADREKAFALGGMDYLAKPFQAAEVLARVEHHLTLQRLQQQLTAQEVRIQAEIASRQDAEAALRAAHEILNRRMTESTATLRASEAMFRYLLGRVNDGYVIVDEEERILYANINAQVYLGLGREIDRTAPPAFMDIVKQQYLCEPQAAWALWPKKMFINKAPVPLYLVRPETPVDKAFWLQVEMLDIAAGLDMQAGRIICLKDITEKTALQEELNRFHSVIAHKLRTPLVPIYTGLTFLIEQIETMSRDDILMFVQNAAEGAEHLYTEIEEIVRYLGAPRIATPDAAFPLANFAALIANISGDLLLPDVTVTVAESLQNQHLALSQWSLEVILWEVLENAQKFHPRNLPVITIDVAPVGVQQVRIQVWDDGLTLSPEQLVRMWMPYYQVDKFTTGQVAGMGLGLSMVATQVWSVGGTCRSFNREDGPGIVIEFVLPSRA
ncbi:MAG TPA: ATP-binding protein [Anaerolineae bacterium]|nr:ATP-binding protein [Anaerolineae bacterium]HQI85991.1 ATP-binding protein [Anaerolineae bacterium]